MKDTYIQLKKNYTRIFFLVVLGALLSTQSQLSYAEGGHFSLGVGLIKNNDSSQIHVALGGEFEYRLDPFFGMGILGSYVFTNPYYAVIGAPAFFLHPLAGEFVVFASPIVQFGSGRSSKLGARLGTRLPIPLAPLTLVPSFTVDFISGGPNYVLGLGVGF